MKNLTTTVGMAALMLCSTAASAVPVIGHDITDYLYQGKRTHSAFNTDRQRTVESIVSRMEAGKPSRFVNALEAVAEDGTYVPDHVFEGKELYGDIDGPDGDIWYFQGTIKYDYIKHNEYYTEELPKEFEFSIYDGSMNLRGTIKDTFELKDDESGVRRVEVLPVVTRNYFNLDDHYEVAVSVLVNPKPYGIRPYTYIYSIGGETEQNGDSKPVMVINGMINDVLDASDDKGENVLMTFITEYNDSGIIEDEILDSSDPDSKDKFWKYNLGNKVDIKTYAGVDASGKFQEVFSKTHIYYQSQGNQQDDQLSLTMVRNGKPVIVYPYYEKVFYNPFYSNQDDMTQAAGNNLIIEIYEQPAPGEKFVLTQTTKLPAVKAGGDDVLFSYYAVGSFRYRDDVIFNGSKADFYITRRDYTPSSDSERQSFYSYSSEGELKRMLFTDSDSHMPLADLPGFDPMELFVGQNSKGGYVFNFVNLRTFETELSLDYGLMLDGPDGEPDYIMANLERTLIDGGKSFCYVAEMRTPGYDDINDINYMRVAWIKRDGSVDRIDQINMGNNVNYATLFLASEALQPTFFHSDAKQEYMMLIKRAIPENVEKPTEEQLLIAQIADKANPKGKELLFLGECEAGPLSMITPMFGSQNRLAVSYGTPGSTKRTTHYYNLPLDVVSGIEDVAGATNGTITVAGTTVSAAGAIEVFNMHGMLVLSGADSLDLGTLAPGIYIARSADATVKVAVK